MIQPAKPAAPSPPSPTPAPRGEGAMRRDLGVLLGVFVVINSTIGTGIFKTPAKVARLAGSMPAFYLVWIAGAVIALAGALSLAELAAAWPRTGGLYEYLRRAYGPGVAFLFGWTKLTLLIPSAVGSFAKLAAEALAALCGWAPDAHRDSLVGVGVAAVATLVNLLRVRTSATQQAVITALKYAGVAFLALLGLFAVTHAVPTVTAAAPAFHATPTFAGACAALVSVMWVYDGWADLSSMAGEVRDPGRTLPRALAAGTLAIAVVYLAACAAYGHVLGLGGLRGATTGSDMAAARLAAATLGARGRALLSAIILVSCLGGCMSSLLTGSRVFVALADDGLFPRWLGQVSARNAIPARAVVLAATLGATYVLWESFEQLTDAFVVGYFPFYMAAVAAVFVLRRREARAARPFRVPLYPLTPLVFLTGAAVLLWGATKDVDRTALYAFAIMAVGIPLYLAYRVWAKLRPIERPSG